MISLMVSGAIKSNSSNCVLSLRLSLSAYFHAFLASAYILYMNQYAGMMTSSLSLSLLLSNEKGMGISISDGYAPFATMLNEANLELCLKLTLSPGQKPRPAMISPSALRELWLDPI